jgi:hypothetical protein
MAADLRPEAVGYGPVSYGPVSSAQEAAIVTGVSVTVGL